MSVSSWRVWFSFRGRLARRPFWWSSLGLWAVFAILFVFLSNSLGRAATWMLYPPFLWIALALASRRLHDRGKAIGWLLLALIPIIGPLWLIVTMGFRAGTVGDNQYGDDPLLVDVDYLIVK